MRPVTKYLSLLVGFSLTGYLVYLLIKKDDEDDEYMDTLDKATKSKSIEISVPADMVKIIIGRNGRNISRIQEQSNTRMCFKENKGSGPAAKTIVIKGSTEGCNVAENLVQELLKNQLSIECDNMWIPVHCTARVIGRNGARIQHICALSGAKVNVDSDVAKASNGKTRCTLKGTKDQILVAKSLIEEIVNTTKVLKSQVEQSVQRRSPRLPPKGAHRDLGEEAPPAAFAAGTQFEVYVSAMIDPSRFWVQIHSPKAAELDILVDEMTDYYQKPENRDNHVLENVEEGSMVAAVFKYDMKWYRAEVLRLSDNRTVAELYYVDYGDIDNVPVEALLELRTDFLRLHFQAIECFLARVEPAGGAWSDEAIDKFEEWTHVGRWRRLSAKIDGYSARPKMRAHREGSPVPGVDLYDVKADKDVDIANELVCNGYATYKTTPTTSMTSSHSSSS